MDNNPTIDKECLKDYINTIENLKVTLDLLIKEELEPDKLLVVYRNIMLFYKKDIEKMFSKFKDSIALIELDIALDNLDSNIKSEINKLASEYPDTGNDDNDILLYKEYLKLLENVSLKYNNEHILSTTYRYMLNKVRGRFGEKTMFIFQEDYGDILEALEHRRFNSKK